VEVHAFVANGQFTLEFCDDGPGFDPARKTEGMGLANMRSRVERLGGQFQIVPGSERGTQVTATIPVATATARL
jgi:signal transduction histidine kinase